MNRVLIFDVKADYAHYKQIYMTTSALTYPLPFKTAIYGLVGAIIGLEKEKNQYLQSFQNGNCQIALQLLEPVRTQRIPMNLSGEPGAIKGNRKPTLMEFISRQKLRIYFQHKDNELTNNLSQHLKNHTSVYTPTLGLANLLADFNWVKECEWQEQSNTKQATEIHSIIPKNSFVKFDTDSTYYKGNQIVEVNQYALEMDMERNVTERDSMIFDRAGKSITAFVKKYWKVQTAENPNIIFF